MNKNLFFRLCLMIAALSLNSCRQDLLPEKETYNNSSAFQLTSKRISLDEAKHKTKLLPKLEQVEVELKKQVKKKVQGKVINYGNGVSIDTNDVIYIENGPNYYTYTFKINRENAPADAPVENLVLSPLSDGNWKEELITYNLTAQEKQTMLSGGAVNLAGKVTKEILQSGTYSSGIMNKGSWDNCYMVTSSYYTMCSGNEHNHGELADEDGGPCEAEEQSILVITVDVICSTPGGGYTGTGSNESGTTPGGFNPSSGGGGSTNPNDPNGSNGSNNPNQPCGGNGIPSQPQDPNSTLGGNEGCNNGTVTLPNLEFNPTINPCVKIKAQRADAEFNNKITDLEGKTGLKKETGYIQKWGGSYEYKDNAGATGEANTLTLPGVATNDYIKAFMHTHINDIPDSGKKGVKMFSPADAVYFMDLVQNAQTKGESLSDVYAVMVSSIGNYQIRFTGNKFQIKTFTDQEKEYHREPFARGMEKYLENPKQLEFRFLKYIQKEMLLYGITLYRMNTDGTTTEIKLNADKTDTVENICP